jgi:hypothetical protein
MRVTLAFALAATLALGGAAAAQTQGQVKKKRPVQAPAATSSTTRQDDQSWLFVNTPQSDKSSPGYVAIGQRASQSPLTQSYVQSGQAKPQSGGYVLPIPGTAGSRD